MLSDGFVWKQTLVCLVRNMCQDRNVGLLKRREEIHAGDFLCQQGQFSASQTQDRFKQKHKFFEIHLLCLDSVSLEYSECYKFNYNCRGKKQLISPHFTWLLGWSHCCVLLVCQLLCSNTAWQWKHEWPLISTPSDMDDIDSLWGRQEGCLHTCCIKPITYNACGRCSSIETTRKKPD